ncbi:HAD family hydrolase [Wenzhouxiangella marina]|uniref:Phosphoglycolate phosphatase n=1 Tax=Wenzhouxiangella marina TaxID=1579979 RepID=A0A0K0XWL5_9GAMM|nr:HAD-IA family hydrolase [Wenzhouxiangella marina]AKS42073.1 Phosphoglycolate phosphatase [Wenzhouxiangella marina]MBB6086158.1 phosphoglycolate phosphatase [Wenzhouxiangella marina]
MSERPCRALLFDLDGTLVDTAPDLVGTLNDLRLRRGLPALPEAQLRPAATRGALGLIDAGFGPLVEAERESLREEFLAHYRTRLWKHSAPFPEVAEGLEALRAAGYRLAIVTNKVEALARPVVECAGWHHLFDTLVAGDTTARPKPDPLPVQTACERLGVAPEQSIFLGDDERDVVAGRAAGTRTVIAAWGYIEDPSRLPHWGGDRVIERFGQLFELLPGT